VNINSYLIMLVSQHSYQSNL